MENKFFTFIKPYLITIDNGSLFRRPFKWLYALIAIVNLLAPFYLMNQAIENKVFDSPFKVVIAFLFIWIIIAFVSWISFQLWWNRKEKVEKVSQNGDDFIATPVFSHFIQTLGEWIGTWVGIIGFSANILILIFIGSEDNFYFSNLSTLHGLITLDGTLSSAFMMLIIGFLIIVFARFVAEQIRALAAIANNTKKEIGQKEADHLE
jgi:hypothetical protein